MRCSRKPIHKIVSLNPADQKEVLGIKALTRSFINLEKRSLYIVVFPFHKETNIYLVFHQIFVGQITCREQTLPCMFWNEIAQKFVVFSYPWTSFSCLMTQPILGRGYAFLYIYLLYKRQPFFHVIFKMHLQRFSTVKEIDEILLRKKLRFVQRT